MGPMERTDGNRAVIVRVPEVAEDNLVDVSVTSAGASPGLDTRSILRVLNVNVVDVDVLDNIYYNFRSAQRNMLRLVLTFHAVVLSETANAYTVSTVAENSVDIDVCRVGLERHAVVAVVDAEVVQRHVTRVVDVDSVRLAVRLATTSPCVGTRDDGEIVEQHVLGRVNEERPARALANVQVTDDEVISAVCEHEMRWT